MRNIYFSVLVTLALIPFGVQAAVVNINTANVVQLDTLPGVGPSKAAAIVEYRTAHGPFAKIEDLQQVKGIGPSTYAGLKSLITTGAAAESVGNTPVVQPPASSRSSNTKQVVIQATAPAKSTSVSTIAHETSTVSAPGATAEAAALGALVPHTTPTIRNSLWVFGFLGVVMLAGAALLIL